MVLGTRLREEKTFRVIWKTFVLPLYCELTAFE